MFKNLAIFALASVSVSTMTQVGVAAVPHAVEVRDVWSPNVLEPASGTTWTIGSVQTITWDTSNPPSDVTDQTGTILLANNGSEDVDHPLATGFSIFAGTVDVTVPAVVPGDQFQVVLLGDSGNLSPGTFTITL